MTESVWSAIRGRAGTLKELWLSLISDVEDTEALSEMYGNCEAAGISVQV